MLSNVSLKVKLIDGFVVIAMITAKRWRIGR